MKTTNGCMSQENVLKKMLMYMKDGVPIPSSKMPTPKSACFDFSSPGFNVQGHIQSTNLGL
jgi:hypothetical protein